MLYGQMDRARRGKAEMRYAVVFVRSFTGSQVGAPEWHADRTSAESAAREFNRVNQDQTWNAVTARVEGVRLNTEGYAV